MDIELTPKELSKEQITTLARIAVNADSGGVSTAGVISLLRHILWQEDENEKIRVRLDPYLDQARGSPAIPLH